MDYIVRPNIRLAGAGKAAGREETPQDRLLKYIPLSIAGAYPLLENGIAEYVKAPIKGLPPLWIERAVFVLLILYYVIFLTQKFNKAGVQGWTRVRLQTSQTLVSIAAFFVWTYSIKSAIWSDIYNAGLAIILAVIFVLFASLYAPTVDLDSARTDKLLPP